MVTRVRKRDGREVFFNIEKITNAIYKASMSAGQNDYPHAVELTEKVVNQLSQLYHEAAPSVEEIQDIVEQVLIANNSPQIAKNYILYRAERTRIREMNTRLMKVMEEITFKEAKDNDLKRENANINGDTAMGTMLKYGTESAKHFYEMYVLDPAHSRLHKEGDIHIHDLDFLTLTTTCCQIDIDKLFRGGFNTGHGSLRTPNDISSYSALSCIAIQSNQNDQHGGQSIPNFDYGMAPGVTKTFIKEYKRNLFKAMELLTSLKDIDSLVETIIKEIEGEKGLLPSMANNNGYQEYERERLERYIEDAAIVEKIQAFALKNALQETDKKTYQAMEAFIHNLNTMHSRAGSQVPFSSINYGLDQSPEGRLVVKNLLLATEAGLGNGETAIFPIQIYRVKEGINYHPGEPNYDLFQLACRVSAKRLFPNFSFIDAPFNLKYYQAGRPETEVAYMGCRTRVMGNQYDPNNEIAFGRGNLSFTTINLPRLALKSRGEEARFYEMLDQMIDSVIQQLLERFEIQAAKKVKNFPFLMGEGVWLGSDQLKAEDEIREVIKHGTLTLGFIGLAECLKALRGAHHGESEASQQLGLEIIGHMRKRMDEASERYGMNFTLIATPAEGTAGRFVKMDRQIFGKLPGVTDREYYTNSFHVPVYHKINAYDKIRLEAPYHELTNAGHITYIELDGSPSNNLEAFEKIIRTMKEMGIGYGSINHPVDRDPVCGYTGVIKDICPQCGRREGEVKFDRIRRITGYLVGTLDRFNDAKKEEEKDRVKHL